MSYICLHEWLICTVNVGKYTSHMDPMGYTISKEKHEKNTPWSLLTSNFLGLPGKISQSDCQEKSYFIQSLSAF